MSIAHNVAPKEQIATCIEVKVLAFGEKDNRTEKEVYTFSLDGEIFQVWSSKFFSAKKDDRFRPVIQIGDDPYVSTKNGKAYNRRVAFINWEKVGG